MVASRREDCNMKLKKDIKNKKAYRKPEAKIEKIVIQSRVC